MTLKKLVISEIHDKGPMVVSRFMEHCLYNERFGYYAEKKNTIGASGDFVTSPEISQVFGELIGLWLAQAWIDRGKPSPFNLVELGPGNGTMMRDVLRAARSIPKFIDSAAIILVETSIKLKMHQQSYLKGYSVKWVKTVDEIPEEPTFLIANEFLDALPIRQFRKNKDVWFERSIDVTDKDELFFIYKESNYNKELHLLYSGVPNNVIIETSDITKDIVSTLTEKLDRNSGVALFIDYGYFEGTGDTLQAVYQHSYADPLKNLGKTDLTAQVNFKEIYNLVIRKDLRASVLTTQGNFLEGLSIKKRLEILTATMPEEQKKSHILSINRLINPEEMGDLFKVIGITNKGSPALPILEQL